MKMHKETCLDHDEAAVNMSPLDQCCNDRQTPTSSPWRQDRLAAVAHRWKLNAKEQQQLLELQDHLSDVIHEKNNPEEVVRFLREARTTKGAERLFRKFILFRMSQVDTILNDFEPPRLFKTHYPMTLLNACDKEGDGIWLERPGATDFLGLCETFGRVDVLRYCDYVREQALHSSWIQNYRTTKQQEPRVIGIVDVQGLNRRHFHPMLMPLWKDLIFAVQNYYCGFIKKIVVIREPPIFKLFWRIVKPLLNENLRNLLVFAGSDYERVLGEYIDNLEESLPPCLIKNGKGTIAKGMPQQLEGGLLPSEDEPALMAPKSILDDSNSTNSMTHDDNMAGVFEVNDSFTDTSTVQSSVVVKMVEASSSSRTTTARQSAGRPRWNKKLLSRSKKHNAPIVCRVLATGCF